MALVFFYAVTFNISSHITEKNNDYNSIAKKVEAHIKGIKFISARFVQLSSFGDHYEGNFWLSKKNGQDVKIIYTSGLNQEIFIKNNTIHVIDHDDNDKDTSYSISQTPIYSILSNGLSLKNERYSIIENSHSYLRIKIEKGSLVGNMNLTLVFSKYLQTGNLKNLEGWIIDDGKTETLFSFDPDTLFVNDENKLPLGVFEKAFKLSKNVENLSTSKAHKVEKKSGKIKRHKKVIKKKREA